jgi:hypothetical protein
MTEVRTPASVTFAPPEEVVCVGPGENLGNSMERITVRSMWSLESTFFLAVRTSEM